MSSKLQNLTATTAPVSTDIAYLVVDPTGTPLDRQSTWSDVSKALVADNIPNTPAGAIAATDVQAAINELDTEKAPAAGSTSIVTLGTIATGVWNGTDIAVADGGTGASDAATALSNLGGIGGATTDTLTNKTFDANGTGNSLTNVETADIASGSKTGLDTELVTGTAGTSGNLGEWNADGDLVDSSLATSDVVTGASTDTFTNKTFDADGTGNVITNIGSSEIKSEIITGNATVTGIAGDFVLISDTSDSGNLKKVDVNDFLGGGGATTMKFVTDYATAGRHSSAVSGTGANSFGGSGVTSLTGTTSGSHARLLTAFTNGKLTQESPIFTASINNQVGTTGEAFVGVGFVTVDGTGHTFTTQHFGFKLIDVAGTTSLFATQADGTTETASSALTTVASGESLELIAVKNGTSSIDYFFRKAGGVLSSATNLTTNLPTTGASASNLQASTSNVSTTNNTIMEVHSFSYER